MVIKGELMRRCFSYIFLTLALISGAFVLAGCNRTKGDVQQAIQKIEGPHVEIAIRHIDSQSQNEFDPAQISIAPGTTVVWMNEDTAPHSVTEGTPGDANSAFDEEIPPGSYMMMKFDEPGVYAYYCRYHESNAGEITVQGQ
jgi:plastocyanin